MRKATIIFFSLSIMLTACNSSTKVEEKEKTASVETISNKYSEKHRLQFHFSPEANWMNDPNGMVYLDGEYHLFYQYYPDSTVWGPMHWGHAISTDLVHWKQMPIALYPDDLGYIFSGSAVYDKKNTSGLGTKDNPPLVAIFTYHNMDKEKSGAIDYQTQAIAYSLDKGRTWKKYDDNPVLVNPGINDFRDPKVFWHEDKWIMTLAVKDHIRFYSSYDLRNWSLESEFGKNIGAHGGVWECPDLFQLNDQWVLLVSINPGGPNGGSATQYFVGDFDGKEFEPHDDSTRWLDFGRDNYAGVTWSNIPREDNRRLFIGWMSNWDYAQEVPTERWRSAMTVPRELSLETNGNYTLQSIPVEELEKLRFEGRSISTSGAESNLNPMNFKTYDLEISLNNQAFNIILSNASGDSLTIDYDGANFQINRDHSGDLSFAEKFGGIQQGQFLSEAENIKLRLLVDVGSIELFVNEGELTMTSLFFPQEPLDRAKLISNTSKQLDLKGKIYSLKSIWNNADRTIQ